MHPMGKDVSHPMVFWAFPAKDYRYLASLEGPRSSCRLEYKNFEVGYFTPIYPIHK